MSERPAKTQISLSIHPVWSESSLCTQKVAKDPRFLHADSEDSDQTRWMPRLIWVFAEHKLTLLVLSCRGSNPFYTMSGFIFLLFLLLFLIFCLSLWGLTTSRINVHCNPRILCIHGSRTTFRFIRQFICLFTSEMLQNWKEKKNTCFLQFQPTVEILKILTSEKITRTTSNGADRMANSVDPDQTATSEAVWSESTLLAQTSMSENLDYI